MTATRNIVLERDTDFSESLTFYSDACFSTTLDVSDYTFQAQIRATDTSSTVIATFTIDTTDAATGNIVLSLTAAQTLALTAGSYFWDLRCVDANSVVSRWVSGTATVAGTITRA